MTIKKNDPHRKHALWISVALLAVLAIASLSGCASNSINTKLIRAAEQGQILQVRKLVEKGANVNAHDGEGWTPYLAAASNGHREVMDYLQNRGAERYPNY